MIVAIIDMIILQLLIVYLELWIVHIPDSIEMADIRGPNTPLTGTAVVPFPAYWRRISNVLLVTLTFGIGISTALSTPPALCLISKFLNTITP